MKTKRQKFGLSVKTLLFFKNQVLDSLFESCGRLLVKRELFLFLSAFILVGGLYLFSARPAEAYYEYLYFPAVCPGGGEYVSVSIKNNSPVQRWVKTRWVGANSETIYNLNYYVGDRRIDISEMRDIAYVEISDPQSSSADITASVILNTCHDKQIYKAQILCSNGRAILRWANVYGSGTYHYLISDPNGYTPWHEENYRCQGTDAPISCDSRPVTYPVGGGKHVLYARIGLGLGQPWDGSLSQYAFYASKTCQDSPIEPVPTTSSCSSPNQCLSLSSCPQARQVAGFSCANLYETCCAPAGESSPASFSTPFGERLFGNEGLFGSGAVFRNRR